MTESEWCSADDPHRYHGYLSVFCPRKLRLFACACATRRIDDSGGQHWKTLTVAEQVADSSIPLERLRELRTQWKAARNDARLNDVFHSLCNADATWAAISTLWHCAGDRGSESTSDIGLYGEAFSTVYQQHRREELSALWLLQLCVLNASRPAHFNPAWRTETTVAIAAGIYEQRAFDRLPILADALEEAGCDNADVLAHCRGPGPHARGCWVVDGVLGKS